MSVTHRATYHRAILLGLLTAAALVPIGLWARDLNIGPGTVPIYDPQGRAFWLVGLLLALASGLLAQFRDPVTSYALSTAEARELRYEPASELPTAWIFPAVTTFAIVMLLAVYHSLTAIIGIALGSFALLVAGAITRHHLFDVDDVARQRARGIYTILIHVVAFLSLSMVYINKVRSLFSATAVLLFAALLLLQLTEGEDALFARRLVYALVGGVMLGQATWVLNYWRATGWTGGAALLIFFYFAAGLIAAEVRRGAGRRDVIEFGGIGAVALGIIAYSVLR